jgi:hypothetical protein
MRVGFRLGVTCSFTCVCFMITSLICQAKKNVKNLIGSAGASSTIPTSMRTGDVRGLIVLLLARREAGLRRRTHHCQATAVLNGRGTQVAIFQRMELCFVEVWKSSSRLWRLRTVCADFPDARRVRIRSWTSGLRDGGYRPVGVFLVFLSKPSPFCLTNGGWTRDMGLRIAIAYSE